MVCFIAWDRYWPRCPWPQIIPWKTVASKLFTGVTALLMKRNFLSFRGPWRQQLLTSADQDILGASEYICNLRSAGTKPLSPLVVDFSPKFKARTRRESSPASTFARIRIADKNLWRRRADCPAWTEAEHSTRREHLGIGSSRAARFTLLHRLFHCTDGSQ